MRSLPLAFEANFGQAKRECKFVASRPEYVLFLETSAAVLRHSRGSIRIAFVGARRDVSAEGEEPLSGTANYIIGNRPARWLTSIPMFSKVRYRGLYPGVDLLFHASGGELEFDLILAPGARPSVIQLGIGGASRIRIDEGGGLVFDGSGLRLGKPLIYQEHHGGRRPVAGGYVLQGGGRIRLHVPEFDTTLPLVIDPVLSFSTYLGGSGTENGIAGSDMKGAAIAADSEGNVYVTGSTVSPDWMAAKKLGASETASADLFIAKFGPGGDLIYSTRIGGSQLERGFGIAVDSAGNAYATGRTQSSDFPIVNAAQSRLAGIEDAYVLKLNAAGSQLLYSTFLGGAGTDFACGIAIDAAGSAYVTGESESFNFPTTGGAFQRQYAGGVSDAFLAKMSAAGALVHATYLGGGGFDHGESVAVDSAGNVYATGYTSSANFPLSRALQSALKGSVDAFVTQLSGAGSELLYSTYLGGSDIDGGAFLAVDAAGSAHVTGVTGSADFPTTAGVVQQLLKGEQDAFVTKLSPDGAALVFSTLLGGAKSETGNGVAVDRTGNVYVVGNTRSPEFPAVHPVQSNHAGNDEVFVSKLNGSGSQILFSTFLGGTGWELGWGIALGTSGSVYITGRTDSADFPLVKAHQSTYGGSRDAFVARILEEEPLAGQFVTVSAASFIEGAALAADSIAAGFGEQLATDIEAAAALPLPTSLAGVTVKIKDAAGREYIAPLFFVSPRQINYLIPEGCRPGLATVTVYSSEKTVASGGVYIERVAPALFAKNGDGKGVPAAMVIKVAADGKQTVAPTYTCGTEPGSCVPAPISLPAAGEQVILLLYGTGIRGRTSLDQVRVQVGGFQAEVQYAGAQNEYPGLDQVNAKLPPMTNIRGTQAVFLTVDGRVANMVQIRVQ
jgi:uncharacterized protein (TIGR03437 family)